MSRNFEGLVEFGKLLNIEVKPTTENSLKNPTAVQPKNGATPAAGRGQNSNKNKAPGKGKGKAKPNQQAGKGSGQTKGLQKGGPKGQRRAMAKARAKRGKEPLAKAVNRTLLRMVSRQKTKVKAKATGSRPRHGSELEFGQDDQRPWAERICFSSALRGASQLHCWQ